MKNKTEGKQESRKGEVYGVPECGVHARAHERVRKREREREEREKGKERERERNVATTNTYIVHQVHTLSRKCRASSGRCALAVTPSFSLIQG